jgi:hypothetical protein
MGERVFDGEGRVATVTRTSRIRARMQDPSVAKLRT